MTASMDTVKDISGHRFTLWTVMGRCRRARNETVAYWVCRCDCGTIKSVNGGTLRRGLSKSCGCLRDETFRETKTHPLKKAHPAEYATHARLFMRCNNKNSSDYKDYGARGISVCARWTGKEGFKNFMADMGPRPSQRHSIDRINVNGNYEPDNCRWATSKQQTRNYRRNRMVTIDGDTKCLKEWCEERGVSYTRTFQRLRRGWAIERALTAPQDNRGGRQ